MTTVKHSVKVTNTWKFAADYMWYCIGDAANRCLIDNEGVAAMHRELYKLGSAFVQETPFIIMSIVRYLEWDIAPADIETHLAEMVAAGILKRAEVPAHRSELLERAMAQRSPPRPFGDASILDAASALLELHPAEPLHGDVHVIIPPPESNVKMPVSVGAAVMYTGAYQSRAFISFDLAGPAAPPGARPYGCITEQCTDLNDIDIASLVLPEMVLPREPVCPPAPQKSRRPRLWVDPLAHNGCVKQLHF